MYMSDSFDGQLTMELMSSCCADNCGGSCLYIHAVAKMTSLSDYVVSSVCIATHMKMVVEAGGTALIIASHLLAIQMALKQA